MRSTITNSVFALSRWTLPYWTCRAAPISLASLADSRMSMSDSERGGLLVRDASGHALEERLALAGISDAEIARKSRLFTRASAALGRRHGLRLWVPGRIEFLGKHTDYAGGRDDRRIRITDAVSSEQIEIELSPTLPPADGSWANYAITVTRRIARNF